MKHIRKLCYLAILLTAIPSFSQPVPVGIPEKAGEGILISSGSTIENETGSLEWIIGENLIIYGADHKDNPEAIKVPELNNALFEVYPSITSDFVTVKAKGSDPEDLTLQVYDMSRNLVDEEKWNKNPMELNLSDYKNALYLIMVFKDEKELYGAFKVIKK